MKFGDGNNTGTNKPRSFAEMLRESKIRSDAIEAYKAEQKAMNRIWETKSEKELIEMINQADFICSKAQTDKRFNEGTRKYRIDYWQCQSKRAQLELYKRNPDKLKSFLISSNIFSITRK